MGWIWNREILNVEIASNLSCIAYFNQSKGNQWNSSTENIDVGLIAKILREGVKGG